MMANEETHTISFATATDWEQWLAANHAKSGGIWLQIFKKNSGEASVTYPEALDEALCYGWIDGQSKKFDGNSWIQKFTPRRAKSMWSKRNMEHIERLTIEKRMKDAGIKAYEDAKKDGRLALAYDSPANSQTPADFIQLLESNPSAKVFFNTLNKTNRYAINWRLQTAKKPETREKRMKLILEMLANGKQFH
jgi:uncharacterized protein YdeI (YjbR/CyaY-like superfamily)